MPTRLFISDDHSIMRDGLRRLLSADPAFQVVGEAGDTTSAWQKIQDTKPDVVITDLDMPSEGGVALTKKIKTAFPGMKVIVLTGHVDAKLANESLAAGAAGYLLKTNGAAELALALETVGKGQVYLCSATTTSLVRNTQMAAQTKASAEKSGLPEREMQVLKLVVRGLRNKEIASELNLNVKTVETYRSRLMKRFNCASPAELVRHAIREGLAEL